MERHVLRMIFRQFQFQMLKNLDETSGCIIQIDTVKVGRIAFVSATNLYFSSLITNIFITFSGTSRKTLF